MQAADNPFTPDQNGSLRGRNQPFGVLAPSATLPQGHPGATGARYYTIQRVNGNGGNGRADGVGGPHRHTLEESDRVKKNSVLRHMLKEEKEKKKVLVSKLVFICEVMMSITSLETRMSSKN
jgi:hypothetical protein